jgi:NADH-quinone oxidoreductase subunit N
MWTADVYEGAPVPVTAFIATVSKGGMIVLLVRFFTQVDGYRFDALLNMFAVLAIASMLIGNLLALQQQNVKRILAYSSIAHMGYVLVAFLAGGTFGTEAMIFYLITYFITSLGAFGIIAMLSDEERDAESVDDYKGLFWRRPWTAALLTSMLLSLAGIPLTAGFIGKFYVVAAGVERNLWIIAGVLVISSVIGLFYYIRIIAAMFEREGGRELLRAKILVVSSVTVAVLAVLVLWLGVAPDSVISLIRYCLT